MVVEIAILNCKVCRSRLFLRVTGKHIASSGENTGGTITEQIRCPVCEQESGYATHNVDEEILAKIAAELSARQIPGGGSALTIFFSDKTKLETNYQLFGLICSNCGNTSLLRKNNETPLPKDAFCAACNKPQIYLPLPMSKLTQGRIKEVVEYASIKGITPDLKTALRNFFAEADAPNKKRSWFT